MAWLYKETLNRLSVLRARVQEGSDLQAAVEFARYVQWSGICRILQPFDNTGPHKVDSVFLRWSAGEVERLVCECHASGKAVRDTSHLESINRKLDLIAGELVRMNAATTPTNVVTLPDETSETLSRRAGGPCP